MYVLLGFPFLVVCFGKRMVLRVDTIRKRDEIFVVHEPKTYLHNKGEKSVQIRTLMCSELFDQCESLII